MPKSASPILVYGGAISESTKRSAIKKGGPTWEDKDRHHLAQVDYVQGKGMILIGFLFYRSHDVSERPDYRIVNRTIKRGSRPSILIISFVERSSLCILLIIFICTYLALIMMWSWFLSCLSWQGQVHRKRFSYASSIAFSVLEILLVHPFGRFHHSNPLHNLPCLFQYFHFL